MTRDEVIAIAKQCGHWSGETIEMNDVGIQRFAALIHDHLTWSDILSPRLYQAPMCGDAGSGVGRA